MTSRFFVTVSLILAASLTEAASCSRILEVGSLAELQWSPVPVEVIYFPETQHTKLRIGGDVFSNQCPIDSCVRESMAAFDRLPSFGGGIQLRFRVKATHQEVGALIDYLEQGHFSEFVSFGCTHSVCRALNKTTKMWIPMPFNLTPFLNGVYLMASRFTPGTRVKEVTLHGPRTREQEAFALSGWDVVWYGISARRIK